ncbi:MAG TPA: YhbY family RNA-binding protein [Planctomycetota bacterium]|nr:YhbY family RNA-binding protein [Planctomycetota bacterium]
MDLNAKQRSFLKSQAQALEPKLQIGKNGLSDSFLKELEVALDRDELVKVRIGKFVEETLADEAAAKTKSALVAKLGRTVLYYKAAKEPKISLP